MVEDAEFRVVARHVRTTVVIELELRPVGTPMDYRPGQYVLLGDLLSDVPVRSYSIANAPQPSGRLTVLVTNFPAGETSGWLHSLRVGDGVLVSGPYGTFVAADTARPVLGLAGGSGLAPIRALAEESALSGLVRPFTVVFSARTEADVMDAELFDRWSRRNPGLWFLRTLTRSGGAPPLGRVPAVLPTLFRDLSAHQVYIAGGPGFVSACANAARALGVAPARLHTEEFFAEPRPWTTSPVAAPALT
jgi:CDP-4-dehydro-6-deoxyglucose reductase